MITFLWTHPRSVSTAFERIMAERGDMYILHEPFSGLYYELEKKAEAVGYESAGTLQGYDGIKQGIMDAAANGRTIFIKDMAYHCLSHLQQDFAWLAGAKHIFLVREPDAAIASHYAMNTKVSSEEIGYQALWDLYELLQEELMIQPLVIRSEMLKMEPEATIRQVCQYCGMAYLPEALEWKKPPPEGWKSWQAWHQDATNSKGIENKQKQYTHTVENTELLKQYKETHQPYYERLLAKSYKQAKTDLL